jgi:hypothetical protein
MTWQVPFEKGLYGNMDPPKVAFDPLPKASNNLKETHEDINSAPAES